MRFPEREGHAAPVELVCQIGQERYALEHTRIEAFENQLQDGVDFVRALQPVEERLNGRLPRDMFFQLSVPVGSFRELRQRDIPAIQDKVVAWVLRNAGTFGTERRFVREAPEGVPFEISLVGSQWPLPTGEDSLAGKIKVGRVAPTGLEEKRAARIGTALDKKIPKLAEWHREAQTVLVFEDDDIALSNPPLVLAALALASRDRATMPDWVLLALWIKTEVWIMPLYRGGHLTSQAELLASRFVCSTSSLGDILAGAATG